MKVGTQAECKCTKCQASHNSSSQLPSRAQLRLVPPPTHRRLLGRVRAAQHAAQAALPAKQRPLQQHFRGAARHAAVAARGFCCLRHVQRVHLGLKQGDGIGVQRGLTVDAGRMRVARSETKSHPKTSQQRQGTSTPSPLPIFRPRAQGAHPSLAPGVPLHEVGRRGLGVCQEEHRLATGWNSGIKAGLSSPC